MQPIERIARVLIIAGSDSGGGAGIQGDIKTVTCLGGYAATAITALTAQNTQGVFGIHEVPPTFIAQQIKLVLDDIGADAIKTGMLHSAEVIESVADALQNCTAPLVVDPVMVAKGGAPLLQQQALHALKTRLLPLATLLTPNTEEAALLTGNAITNTEDMRHAAHALKQLGARAVLVKGGHVPGETITNLLLDENGEHIFTVERIDSRHTHGTGCALASAIATHLGAGMPLKQAVENAQAYVSEAICHAPGFGQGHGPMGHGFMI